MSSIRLLISALVTYSFFISAAKSDVAADKKQASVSQAIIGGREACLVNPPIKATETALTIFAPILGELGSTAFEGAYDALADYVSDTVKSETSQMTVMLRSANFYRMKKGTSNDWSVEPALDCITIFRGLIGPVDTQGLNVFANRLDPKGHFRKIDNANTVDFPALRRLGLSDYPELYLELSFERNELNTAFRIQPRVIYYRQTGVKPSSDNKVDLNIVMSFTEVGKSSPFAVIPFRLQGIVIGSDLSLESLSFDNPWSTMPPRPDARVVPSELQSRLSAIPAAPINVTITLEETGTPSRYLTFITHLLGKVRPVVSNHTEEALKKSIENQVK